MEVCVCVCALSNIFKNYFFLFYVHWYFARVYVCVRMSAFGVTDSRGIACKYY